jgi:predicted glycoside hydrolase/deacetylase ChbG (UPF0249 family)
VVNADDLGLTKGINAGIRRAHLEGVVGSTSLLSVAREFDDAVAMLHATPTLDAGVHLALVGEDPPVLTAAEVPSLVDRRGTFPLTYRTFLARACAGRVDPGDVRRELGAQLQRALAAGIRVTHLDSHQHVHLWPMVAGVVCDLAVEHAIPLVRLPRAHRRGPVGIGVNVLTRRLSGRLRAAGLVTCDYAGLDEAGAMDEQALLRAVRVLAARRVGTCRPAEINLHPGLPDADCERFDWGYRWADEVEAACSPRVRTGIDAYGYRVSSFAELAAR